MDDKYNVLEKDSPPYTAEELAKARRVPRVKTMRRALGLTQEEFAERYMISVHTLRDWEQGKTEPDGAGLAYLRAIRGNPDAVAKALRTISPQPGISEGDGTLILTSDEEIWPPNAELYTR
jgi:DNA-binding transcriptional regulator YiaG